MTPWCRQTARHHAVEDPPPPVDVLEILVMGCPETRVGAEAALEELQALIHLPHLGAPVGAGVKGDLERSLLKGLQVAAVPVRGEVGLTDLVVVVLRTAGRPAGVSQEGRPRRGHVQLRQELVDRYDPGPSGAVAVIDYGDGASLARREGTQSDTVHDSPASPRSRSSLVI